jgi:hypothetical protein
MGKTNNAKFFFSQRYTNDSTANETPPPDWILCHCKKVQSQKAFLSVLVLSQLAKALSIQINVF